MSEPLVFRYVLRYPGAMRALPGQESRTPPGTPPVTRDRAAEDQRRRILSAAAELVAKRGYQATTVELIVRRAKVGYATFYKSFEDKEDCFAGLLDSAVELASERVAEVLPDDPAWEEKRESWAATVAAVIHAAFKLAGEQPAGARTVLVESLTAGEEAQKRHEAALKLLRDLLAGGRRFNPQSGELPDTLEDTLASAVSWMAYQRLVVGEAEKLEGLAPEAVELVLTPYLGEQEAADVAAQAVAQPA